MQGGRCHHKRVQHQRIPLPHLLRDHLPLPSLCHFRDPDQPRSVPSPFRVSEPPPPPTLSLPEACLCFNIARVTASPYVSQSTKPSQAHGITWDPCTRTKGITCNACHGGRCNVPHRHASSSSTITACLKADSLCSSAGTICTQTVTF